MTRLFILLAFLLLTFRGGISAVSAQESGNPALPSEPVLKATLISGVAGTGDMPELPGGMEISLAPGWHTYWRTPGDSGLAPRFDWSSSKNVKDVRVQWPVPKRKEEAGLFVYAYDQDVMLPLVIIPEEPGKEVTLTANIQALVCLKICIPQTVTSTLVIPAGDAVPTSSQSRLEMARARVPLPADEQSGLRLETAVLGMEHIVFTAFSDQGFQGADIFIETNGMSLSSPPEILPDTSSPNRAIIRVNAPPGSDLTSSFLGSTIRATLVKGETATEKEFYF
jgi:suppressor for copper-sensitivity B